MEKKGITLKLILQRIKEHKKLFVITLAICVFIIEDKKRKN